MKWIVLLLLIFLTDLAIAQKDHRFLRRGDRNYEENDLAAAEEAYRKALEARESAKGAYNLGNTIYQQGRYDEAIKHFEKAAEESREPQARANAYHNLGNAYFQQNDFAKSIEAYKNALRLKPDDIETKINLAQAQRLIPPQPEPEPQEGDSEENNEQDQDQQEQDQQSSGQEQEQEQQQQEQSQDQQSEQSPAEAREAEQDLSREEAERLLQIMENEEQKTMEKLRQAQSKPCNSAKDW